MHRLLLVIVATAALAVSGCGKKSESSAGASSPAPAPSGPRVVEITANDSMKFNVTRIEAAAGEELKIVLRNVGSMPKEAMGHNFVLLKKGSDAQAFVNAAITAKATEYMPASLTDQVIAHTKLLGPKQSDELVIKAPAEPGEYSYLCSFPAHFVAGMRGVLVVR